MLVNEKVPPGRLRFNNGLLMSWAFHRGREGRVRGYGSPKPSEKAGTFFVNKPCENYKAF